MPILYLKHHQIYPVAKADTSHKIAEGKSISQTEKVGNTPARPKNPFLQALTKITKKLVKAFTKEQKTPPRSQSEFYESFSADESKALQGAPARPKEKLFKEQQTPPKSRSQFYSVFSADTSHEIAKGKNIAQADKQEAQSYALCNNASILDSVLDSVPKPKPRTIFNTNG